jgi:hypothetical protein
LRAQGVKYAGALSGSARTLAERNSAWRMRAACSTSEATGLCQGLAFGHLWVLAARGVAGEVPQDDVADEHAARNQRL